jgi:S1-C subfamily serine protease
MMGKSFNTALLVAVGWAAAGAAFAGVEEEQARAVLDQHKTAVVTIQLVIKQKFSMGGRGSQENESRNEVTGTVISPEGLAVVALSATDPTSIYKTMMPDGMDDVQIDSEVSDVKILLGDGTEVPAQVVLRDNDLDLAYVRPLAKPAAPMAFVDLADSAPAQLLDTLVSINRLGKVAGRVYSVSLERVEAIVEKPRRFYIPGNDPTSTNQGCPAFTLDGKVVGLFVIRTIKDTSGSGGRGMFSGNENVIPVLLPAEDILEGARQAPESAPARSAGGEASEEAAPATGGAEQ